MPDTLHALAAMADHVASRLVGDALRRMLGAGADVIVTVHPEPRALLGDGAGRKKPGPKPGRRGPGRPRKAPGPAARGERRVGKAAARASAADDPAALVRTCRRCFRRAAVVPLEGRRVRCSACGFIWGMRAASADKGKAPASPRPPRKASSDVATCGRCDHESSAHCGDKGECLVPRCGCAGFYR